MRIVRDTPDQIVVAHARWGVSLVFAIVSAALLVIAGYLVLGASAYGAAAATAVCTLLIPVQISLGMAERSMLILDRTAGFGELRRIDRRGRTSHRFAMADIHGTRIAGENRNGTPASEDSDRMVTLYVRRGMDEGRYPLTKFQVDAQQALAISERINQWMRDVRKDYADDYVAPAGLDPEQARPSSAP